MKKFIALSLLFTALTFSNNAMANNGGGDDNKRKVVNNEQVKQSKAEWKAQLDAANADYKATKRTVKGTKVKVTERGNTAS